MSINRGTDEWIKMYILMMEYYKAHKDKLVLYICNLYVYILKPIISLFLFSIYLFTWIESTHKVKKKKQKKWQNIVWNYLPNLLKTYAKE